MMRDDFAVFILTHGRPDKVETLKALDKGGYTGRVYIIIDNEDKAESGYIERYGDRVIVFDKLDMASRTDVMDTFEDRRVILFARNASFEIAKRLGLKYFLELDDDYTAFEIRHVEGKKLIPYHPKCLDKIFTYMIEFLEESGALTVAFAQGGDLLGGAKSPLIKERVKRKAMNTFFCRTDTPVRFIGRMNEDVNAYTCNGNKGDILMTVADVSIVQKQTQKTAGGMTDIYKANGTYVKSFYTVICSPNCTTVEMMTAKHQRIHHKIRWDNCVPKIISDKYKKR